MNKKVIIVVVILVIVAGIAYYFWQKNKTVTPVTSTASTPGFNSILPKLTTFGS